MSTTADTTYWAALSARFEAEFANAWTGIVERSRYGSGRRQEPIHTGSGIALIVNEVNYGAVDAQEVLAGLVAPITAVLTQDGRPFVNEWHQGEPTGEPLYYERWEPGARVAHGWIDPTTRRIVQTG